MADVNMFKWKWAIGFKLTAFFIFSFYIPTVFGQTESERNLIAKIEKAPNDSLRVLAYQELANYYFFTKQESKGDSIVGKQLWLAEMTMNPNIILHALFNNPRYRFADFYSRKVPEAPYHYIMKALEYVRQNGNAEYTALANTNLSAYYVLNAEIDKALNAASLGYATALTTKNDSIKIVCCLQLGQVNMLKSETILAYKIYSNALDIANSSPGNRRLLAPVYRAFGQLYKTLGEDDVAKSYYFKSLDINKKTNNKIGIIENYLELGKLYDFEIADEYFKNAEALANEINNTSYAIKAQKLLFFNYMFEKGVETSLQYLKAHPYLVQEFKTTGPNFYDWVLGEVFLYNKQYDSAYVYFSKAEPSFEEGYDLKNKRDFFDEFGLYHASVGNEDQAIAYMQKTIELSKEVSDLKSVKDLSYNLKNIFEKKENFKSANIYFNQYKTYRDSLENLSKARYLTLLEIDNENKRRLAAAEEARAAEARRHNLQYMAITIIVATFFIVLFTLGMFKVSHFVIKILGFFSFIFLFEFLLMLLENYIHHITHGEPWKVWLIKIGLLSFLFPLHHYVEEKVFHFLVSRKLMEMRNRFSLRKFLKEKLPFKKKIVPVNQGPEN